MWHRMWLSGHITQMMDMHTDVHAETLFKITAAGECHHCLWFKKHVSHTTLCFWMSAVIQSEGPIKRVFSVPAHLCTNHVRAGSPRPWSRRSSSLSELTGFAEKQQFLLLKGAVHKLFTRHMHAEVLWMKKSFKDASAPSFHSSCYKVPPLGDAVAKDKATMCLCGAPYLPCSQPGLGSNRVHVCGLQKKVPALQ